MNTSLSQQIITLLQALCGSSDAARRLFDSFAQRQKDSRVTTVDRAAWLAGSDYGSMVQVFKQLDAMGAGRFIPGRHGYVSRIEWNFSIRSLGKAAQGRGKKLEDVAPDADTDDASGDAQANVGMADPEFMIRAGVKAKLSLPTDLSEKEAERLGAFLKTLVL